MPFFCFSILFVPFMVYRTFSYQIILMLIKVHWNGTYNKLQLIMNFFSASIFFVLVFMLLRWITVLWQWSKNFIRSCFTCSGSLWCNRYQFGLSAGDCKAWSLWFIFARWMATAAWHRYFLCFTHNYLNWQAISSNFCDRNTQSMTLSWWQMYNFHLFFFVLFLFDFQSVRCIKTSQFQSLVKFDASMIWLKP